MICALAGLDYRKVRRNDMTGRDRAAYNLAGLLIGDGTFVCTDSGDVAVLTTDGLDGSLEAYELAWRQLEDLFKAAMRKV